MMSTFLLMGELLGNLVFVVVAILAWIVKEAVERKEAQRQGGGSGESPRAPAAEPGPTEVDVVYGRRKIPDALTAPPIETTPAPAPVAAPAARRTPKARPKRKQPVHHVPGASSPESFDTLVGRGLVTDLLVTADASRETNARPRLDGWARLGVGPGASRRQAVRSGILWSEVLGTPRALQGPHRSPVAKRHAR